MTPTSRIRWNRKEFAFILAIVTFICAAVFLSVSLARPRPVASAELGAEWQCRTSFLMTSCTRTPHAETVVQNPAQEPHLLTAGLIGQKCQTARRTIHPD
jgi:hypothetical protein